MLGCTLPIFFHLPPEPETIQSLQESQMLPHEESAEKLLHLFLSPHYINNNPQDVRQLKEIFILDKQDQGMDAFMQQLGAAMKFFVSVGSRFKY